MRRCIVESKHSLRRSFHAQRFLAHSLPLQQQRSQLHLSAAPHAETPFTATASSPCSAPSASKSASAAAASNANTKTPLPLFDWLAHTCDPSSQPRANHIRRLGLQILDRSTPATATSTSTSNNPATVYRPLALPRFVRVIEVGPRDGLQNEKQFVATEDKLELIERLRLAGLRTIEIGSFVSPKWVPQMADTPQITRQIMSQVASSTTTPTANQSQPHNNESTQLQSQRRPRPSFTPSDTTDSDLTSEQLAFSAALRELQLEEHQFNNNSNQMEYPVLTPNLKGLHDAIQCGARHIAVFASCSETFSRANINCSIEESLARFRPLIKDALSRGIAVRGYLSCVVGCPYEGPIDARRVAHMTRQLLAMGCYEVSLGDTIGVAAAGDIERLLSEVLSLSPPPPTPGADDVATAAAAAVQVRPDQIAMHLHDTYGQALASLLVALQFGVSKIDSSIGGLGGCPYAGSDAKGNVATEDVVYMLHSLGVHTGIQLSSLVETSHWISQKLNKQSNASRVSQAMKAKCEAKLSKQQQQQPPS